MRILISILLLLVVSKANAHKGDNNLVICWERNLKPPYLMLDSSKKISGIAVEWVESILNSQGITFEHRVEPWKRCLKELETGSVHMVPNASFKAERAIFSLYSDVLYSTHLKFYFSSAKLKQYRKLTQASDFLPYVVGGVSGFNYSFFKDKLEIDTAAQNRQSLPEKLAKNRVDFAIMQAEVFEAITQRSPRQFSNIPSPVRHKKEYFVLFSKKHSDAKQNTKVFNKGLITLRSSGLYQQIFAKYL